jgi:DNA-binding response OmpR family regulator
MSFGPEFAPDAKSQWLELDPVLQELVLDEIERLIQRPSALPRREFYHDLVHEDQNGKHNIFLRIHVDRTRKKLTVAGVVHHLQPRMK